MDFGAHSWIWTILVGLVIGAIAKLLMPGRDPGGCIITILLGIAGAFVGTWIGRVFAGENYIAGWIMKAMKATATMTIAAWKSRRKTKANIYRDPSRCGQRGMLAEQVPCHPQGFPSGLKDRRATLWRGPGELGHTRPA